MADTENDQIKSLRVSPVTHQKIKVLAAKTERTVDETVSAAADALEEKVDEGAQKSAHAA